MPVPECVMQKRFPASGESHISNTLRVSILGARLSEDKHDNLRRNHSEEYGYRIDGCVCYRRLIPFDCGVGEIEGNRVCHASAEHSDILGVVGLEDSGCSESDNQHRHDGQGGADKNPFQSLQGEYGLEESGSGTQPQPCQIDCRSIRLALWLM